MLIFHSSLLIPVPGFLRVHSYIFGRPCFPPFSPILGSGCSQWSNCCYITVQCKAAVGNWTPLLPSWLWQALLFQSTSSFLIGFQPDEHFRVKGCSGVLGVTAPAPSQISLGGFPLISHRPLSLFQNSFPHQFTILFYPFLDMMCPHCRVGCEHKSSTFPLNLGITRC